ncbi:uncharacterized protein [Glycine max]|uniref:uncharacterized protein n=1 Tax=Glycine max TaxID=3847 RepID=UPI0003DEC495|nr:uncharacterized protein LOC102669573 [Glycine max]|eukprot:XP_006579212.1 uncharacterized protein LOC102669573 [Glycine max]
MDPVKYIFEKPVLTGQIARWQVLLSEFDIVYVTQKAIKGSTLVDYLAQQPINDYQPMHPKFPDEDIMTLFEDEVGDEDKDKWIVWFDGASNALGHGVGAVLLSPDNQCIPFIARLGFDCTNNMAEYKAYALGIQTTIDFKVKLLKVYGDSALGKESNGDALATLASMFQLTLHGDLPYIEFRCYGKPVHCCVIEEEQDGKTWYFNIKRYIKEKEY